MQDVAPLEVPSRSHPPVAGRPFAFGRAEVLDQLRLIPEIEGPLLPLAVGVLGGIEAPCRSSEIAQHIGEDLAGELQEVWVAAALEGLEGGEGDKGLIVEHLFEVGDEPLCIDAVAVEAEAELVVDAAGRHRRQCLDDDAAQPGLAVALVGTEEEEVVDRHRKLRGGAEAVMTMVVERGQLAGCRFEDLFVGKIAGRGGAMLLQGGIQCRSVFKDPAALAVPELAKALHQFDEAEAAAARSFRQVGGGEEGFLVGGHEDCQRPAPTAAEDLRRQHVVLVDIRPFFAIDFDGDAAAPERRRDFGIFEGFVFHDMAPVTGGVADGQENRLVGGTGGGKGLLSPGVPVDGVFGVLQQIGAGSKDQAVKAGAAVGGEGGAVDSEQTRDALLSDIILGMGHFILRGKFRPFAASG